MLGENDNRRKWQKIQLGKASHSVFITTTVGNCVINLFSLHMHMPKNFDQVEHIASLAYIG